VCPIRYRTRHLFNNFTTIEDIATKFEAHSRHIPFISHTTNVLLFKFRCNIFIGVRIIKEMPGSVASGTLVRREDANWTELSRDGFHGDNGELLGFYNTRHFLRGSVLGGGCIP
jgi:hypothetical protein